jgi:hypothetical protein
MVFRNVFRSAEDHSLNPKMSTPFRGAKGDIAHDFAVPPGGRRSRCRRTSERNSAQCPAEGIGLIVMR